MTTPLTSVGVRGTAAEKEEEGGPIRTDRRSLSSHRALTKDSLGARKGETGESSTQREEGKKKGRSRLFSTSEKKRKGDLKSRAAGEEKKASQTSLTLLFSFARKEKERDPPISTTPAKCGASSEKGKGRRKKRGRESVTS